METVSKDPTKWEKFKHFVSKWRVVIVIGIILSIVGFVLSIVIIVLYASVLAPLLNKTSLA